MTPSKGYNGSSGSLPAPGASITDDKKDLS